jgi:hypothetical protein
MGFGVLNFIKFTGEDSKTTFEHVGQFLAQASNFGITDVHQAVPIVVVRDGI